MDKLEHVFYECPDTCEGCMYCNGGLASCIVCKEAEGTLAEVCPGPREPFQVYGCGAGTCKATDLFHNKDCPNARTHGR